MSIRYLSVCSGIEAATVAWHPLGWEPAAFAEIEPFPCSVLAHHYPGVPNAGDFTTITGNEYGAVDLVVGGTPCQDFSVAGLRAGLDGHRGNLTLEFVRLVDRTRPAWVVWENVPGVLSIDRGRAFGAFLGGLAKLGYGFAYRVLDAQYFGVPQRRRRVFVVGHLGDWRPAAAVLFERDSLSGNLAPRREAREGAAGGIEIGPAGGRLTDVNPTIDARSKDGPIRNQLAGAVMCADVAPTCQAGQPYSRPGNDSVEAEALVVGTLSASGKAAGSATQQDAESGLLVCMATGQAGAETLSGLAQTPNCDHEQPIIAHTLRGEGFNASEDGTGRGTPLVVAPPVTGNPYGDHESREGLLVPVSGRTSYSVRRLAPRECERLQGFPDDYTLVPHRGKTAADGPRYRAIGNSMAVPVMRWIGERINLITGLQKECKR